MTAAHNTLQVVGREQATQAGPFLWRTRPTVTLEKVTSSFASASHDGFTGARHRRTVELDGGTLRVSDEIESVAPFVVRWHLAPGRAASVKGRHVDLGDAAVEFDTDAIEIVETDHSSEYGRLERALTIEVRGTRRLVTHIRTSG